METEADALAAALAEAIDEADAPADALDETDALAEALGPAEKLGMGLGLGDGKRVLGTFANESAKMRMKIATTIRTHGFARASARGGNAPR